MSVDEPHIPSPNGVSSKWQGCEPVTKETGIPEGIPTTAAQRGRNGATDEKKPPGGGCPPLSVPSRQTRAPFSRGLFRIGQRPADRQAFSSTGRITSLAPSIAIWRKLPPEEHSI